MGKKILLISDSPYASTGLGRMSKYFLKMFPEHEWIIWGALHPEHMERRGQYRPVYEESDFEAKFKILSPKTFSDDQYAFEVIPHIIREEKPDIVLFSMDYDRPLKIVHELKALQYEVPFTWINYFPMDREDYKNLEPDALRFPDINVCITKFGVDKIHEIFPKLDIKQIWHPIDASEFPNVSANNIRKFRDKTWLVKSEDGSLGPLPKDTFLMGSVNRSFHRKDTARLVRIWSEYMKENSDTAAYLHGSSRTAEGMDLRKLIMETGAPQHRLFCMPNDVPETDALPADAMNKIYRSFDLFVTVSCGEGFGFTTVEAMLAGVPIIAPRNTSFPELVQDFGYLVEPSEMVFFTNSNTCMWPVVNIEDVKKKIQYVRDHYDEAKAKAEAGSKWVKNNLSLEVIAKQWREILK